MSAHKDPKYQTPELIAALRAHGLETNKPSQLSDAFRFGWAEARRFPPVEPAVSDAVLKLSELMRGLELSPASVNLAPGQLYLIGEAICRQAKYALPPATLGAETIADHLFIEERSVGIWLVCVEKVHATEEDAQTACKAWKLKVTGTTAPIDMVLHCPKCHTQHIDAPEAAHPLDEYEPVWSNPPHRSHLCYSCGFIWRPADVETNGVAAVKTKGQDDYILIKVEPTALATESGQPVLSPTGDLYRSRVPPIATSRLSDIRELISKARPMTAKDIFEQKVSWCYASQSKNGSLTKDQIRETLRTGHLVLTVVS